MVDVTVFVEGGGDTNHLRAACREGLRTFLTKAGVTARPVIKARGSRDKAYESFCIAVIDASGWAERFIDELKRRMGL